MAQNYIKDLRVGDLVTGYYLLPNMNIKMVSNGATAMLLGTLSDNSGSIGCKFWNYDADESSLAAGNVVYVKGKVGEYNNALQVSLEEIRMAERDEFSGMTNQLVPTAPEDLAEMWEVLNDAILSITDEDYKGICLSLVLDKYSQEFAQWPAAKSVHHAFVCGLLMHTTNMIRAAKPLAEIYGGFINKDLLMAGTILHDVGKIREFDVSQIGLVSQYSVEGQLMGHLIIGAQEVAEAAKKLGVAKEKSMLLQHLLLSHHGEPEFGAAVKPACAEALLLHCIDSMDAKMETAREHLEKMELGKVSDMIGTLGTRLYKYI